MRISIITAILNSHEIVKRQALHYGKMNLPDDIEIIFVDDGSEPPLKADLKNLTILRTGNKNAWTQGIARNIGAKEAKGEHLICTDIDHILSDKLIDMVYKNTYYDIIRFKREVAVLNENGDITQDWDSLKSYGYNRQRFRIAAHGNSYAIRKELFEKFGGSQQKTRYPNRDEQKIKRWTHRLEGSIKLLNDRSRPVIYLIPNGRYSGDVDSNPFGLFHSLSRK